MGERTSGNGEDRDRDDGGDTGGRDNRSTLNTKPNSNTSKRAKTNGLRFCTNGVANSVRGVSRVLEVSRSGDAAGYEQDRAKAVIYWSKYIDDGLYSPINCKAQMLKCWTRLAEKRRMLGERCAAGCRPFGNAMAEIVLYVALYIALFMIIYGLFSDLYRRKDHPLPLGDCVLSFWDVIFRIVGVISKPAVIGSGPENAAVGADNNAAVGPGPENAAVGPDNNAAVGPGPENAAVGPDNNAAVGPGPENAAVGPDNNAAVGPGPKKAAVGPENAAVGPDNNAAVGPGPENAAVGPDNNASVGPGPKKAAVGPKKAAVGPENAAVGPGPKKAAVGPENAAVGLRDVKTAAMVAALGGTWNTALLDKKAKEKVQEKDNPKKH